MGGDWVGARVSAATGAMVASGVGTLELHAMAARAVNARSA